MVRVRKGGRKKLDRQRFPGGKLRPLFDRGSDRTQAARARFARFHGGKADQQLGDPIGRAWCVGLLENDRVDPAVLRDAGRRYAAAYWAYYEGGPTTLRYDGMTATTAPKGAVHDPGGEAFQRMDRALKDAGREAYSAVQGLCVDGYHFPDEDPGWVGRLIGARLGECGAGEPGPSTADRQRMAEAVFGLNALA